MAYGASLESWLGASPHGFESHILRSEKAPEQSGAFVIQHVSLRAGGELFSTSTARFYAGRRCKSRDV